MAKRKTPQRAKCDEIIEQIHELFSDRAIAPSDTLELMEEIVDAAETNASAIKDDLRRARND